MRVPKMQRHKGKNLARVRIPSRSGQPAHDVYLGPWGSKEAERKYDVVIADLLRNHDQPDIVAVTIYRLSVAYLKYAEGYYVQGRKTDE